MTEPVETERRGRGRPSKWDADTAEQILDMIATGRNWADIETEAGVSARSVQRWADARPDFQLELDAAKRAGAEHLASLDPLHNEPDAQRARVRFERNKWLASKWGSEKYGDRISVEVEHRLDLSNALASARARLAVGVAIDAAGAVPSPARLGSPISGNWPALEDQPSEPVPDFLK